MSQAASRASPRSSPGPPPVSEVFARSSRAYGSGILIAPGLLLVAGHTLESATACQVRLHPGRSGFSWMKARRVWRSEQDDAALLAPDDEPFFVPPGTFTLLRFARRPTSAIDCHMIGFPSATDVPKRGYNDSLEVEGRIQPSTFRGEGRLAVSVVSAQPLDPRRWRGMSGAGIVRGRTLIGIVLETAPDFGSKMLKSLPVEQLFENEEWVALVSHARGGTDLEEAIDEPTALDTAGSVPLDPQLRVCLERRLRACIAQGLPFRTYHKLKCSFEARSGFARHCFAQAGPSVPDDLADWLDRSILEQPQTDRGETPTADMVETDSTFAAARAFAAAEGAAAADERHLLLALFEERGTTTMKMILEWLTPPVFERVAASAKEGRPRRFAVSATPLPPPLPGARR